MNNWKLTYDLEGEVRELLISAPEIPTTEAILTAVFLQAFPGTVPPDEVAAIDDLLYENGVVILNLKLQ